MINPIIEILKKLDVFGILVYTTDLSEKKRVRLFTLFIVIVLLSVNVCQFIYFKEEVAILRKEQAETIRSLENKSMISLENCEKIRDMLRTEIFTNFKELREDYRTLLEKRQEKL